MQVNTVTFTRHKDGCDTQHCWNVELFNYQCPACYIQSKTLILCSWCGPTKNGIKSGIRHSFGHLAKAEEKCTKSEKKRRNAGTENQGFTASIFSIQTTQWGLLEHIWITEKLSTVSKNTTLCHEDMSFNVPYIGVEERGKIWECQQTPGTKFGDVNRQPAQNLGMSTDIWHKI